MDFGLSLCSPLFRRSLPTLFVFALAPCGPVGYYRELLEAGAVPEMSVGFRSSQLGLESRTRIFGREIRPCLIKVYHSRPNLLALLSKLLLLAS
jgi:hypothetical protein